MTYVLAFDLAERHSAAALFGQVEGLLKVWTCDFGPTDKSSPLKRERLRKILVWAETIGDDIPDDIWVSGDLVVVVEDLSHGMANPRPALKTQGALTAALAYEDFPEPEFVFPRVWQTQLGYVKTPGQTTKGWAKNKFVELGYEEFGKEFKGKALVDARDAVLIGHWRSNKD